MQATMPDCFDYSNTRVIINCTEFRIEVPSVNNQILCYFHYKKEFTAKLFIGITHGGFISFKSKVAAGKKSDSQMTVQSGLINYREPDIILMDKVSSNHVVEHICCLFVNLKVWQRTDRNSLLRNFF